ncbi:hypothetical protein DD865_08355, partial [Staphylococcus pseudintermedius]
NSNCIVKRSHKKVKYFDLYRKKYLQLRIYPFKNAKKQAFNGEDLSTGEKEVSLYGSYFQTLLS